MIIDSLLVFLAVGGVRFSARFMGNRTQAILPGSRRALIVGAGDAGEMIARELLKNPALGVVPLGFLDDDQQKHNVHIHGLPVIGSRTAIPRVVAEREIDLLILAMPTASGEVIREVTGTCDLIGIDAQIIPSIHEIMDGRVSADQLRDVDIEDLLRRDPVQTDIQAVRRLVAGRRVLVTGGGGSIGRELCRQLLYCGPLELIILGHGENSVFESYHELKRMGLNGPRLTPLIADTRFSQRILDLFKKHKPEIVFHAAAHKHVPMMERNPAEAITNNIIGTQNILAASRAVDVQRFVMISTDKAVNPTSVMGASKRSAEYLVLQAAQKSNKPYVAVRFGNVLGSRGSVIFTFKNQIAAGGPVTVTHPEIRRYFMTIPEAVQLVLQAGTLGTGGEVFVLDMGEPIKILDLAQDMIKLSGFDVGREIDIQFVGLRPGEKLYEELFIEGEEYDRTKHEKIFIARNASRLIPRDLEKSVGALAVAAERNDDEAIILGLQFLVPEYEPPVPESDSAPSENDVVKPPLSIGPISPSANT